MIIDADEGTITFSTGKVMSANIGIIGIGEDLEPTEGYDSDFDDERLTPEERTELAEYMIGLWKKYGAPDHGR